MDSVFVVASVFLNSMKNNSFWEVLGHASVVTFKSTLSAIHTFFFECFVLDQRYAMGASHHMMNPGQIPMQMQMMQPMASSPSAGTNTPS